MVTLEKRKGNMKNLFFILLIGISISLQAAVKANDDRAEGEKLFHTKSCTLCHKKNTASLGPSISEIAINYSGKEKQLFLFLKGKREPIVDPEKSHIMKGQLLKLKTLRDDKIKAITRYIITINDREF